MLTLKQIKKLEAKITKLKRTYTNLALDRPTAQETPSEKRHLKKNKNIDQILYEST